MAQGRTLKMTRTILLFCVAAATFSRAQTFKTVATFDSTDGCAPQSALIQGVDGNFYGTAPGCGPILEDGGTFFKVTPAGTLTALYNFCSVKDGFICSDGSQPYGGLEQATDGNFYGTTNGTTNNYGTVFKITPSGALTTLYHFCSQPNCADGRSPRSGLVQASDGNFYGSTSAGGIANPLCYEGCGTIFRLTPAGELTTLYSFCSLSNCADGQDPFGNLVQAAHGVFYGTTPGVGAYTYHSYK